MRENPWHFRLTTHQHSRWYRNLLDQHHLTLAWLSELKIDRPEHFLGLSIDVNARNTFEQLESIAHQTGSDNGLDQILDDTFPDDSLGRLEQMILLIQSIALKKIFERVPESQQSLLTSQLNQVCWREGRLCALRRWPKLCKENPTELRIVFEAFSDNPWRGQGKTNLYLPRRIINTSAEFEMIHCPHTSTNSSVQSVSDILCPLRSDYDRGFIYSLQPKLVVDHSHPKDSRCTVNWSYQN
jgi:hypothetical protein